MANKRTADTTTAEPPPVVPPPPPSSSSSTPPLKGPSPKAVLYMVLLTIQFGMQPMLTKKFTPPTVCKTSVVLVQECFKFCLACSMLVASGGMGRVWKGWSISSWIKMAALPSLLYTIQNLSALLAYQNLDGVTFTVLNQTKTLSAALCCYLLMGRRQSRLQVLALVLLLVSALVMERIVSIDFLSDLVTGGGGSGGGGHGERGRDLDEAVAAGEASGTTSSRHLTHGVLPVLFASFLSGLAGAISQKNLQNGGRDPYLFSAELCVASVLILTLSCLAGSEDGRRIRRHGLLDGWTYGTMIPIVTNAGGGIVVGLVTKYAGSVRKGFALIFGMLLAGLIQGGGGKDGSGSSAVSDEQIVGGLIAALSLWLHATNPYVEKVKKLKEV